MFDDSRSKKVVLVAHCLLNQNSISDGTADLPGQFDEIIDLLRENKIGIIQLPCPELHCLGLDRGDANGGRREVLAENTRIRGLLNKSPNLEKLKDQSYQVVRQIQDYRKYEFTIVGLIGVNRSPSCGVETTTLDNHETHGNGVFIRIIKETLDEMEIRLKMIGVKTSRKDESLEKVRRLIGDAGTPAI